MLCMTSNKAVTVAMPLSSCHRTFHLRSKEEVSVLGVDAYRFRAIDSDFQPDPNYHTNDSTPVGLIFLGVLQTPEAPAYGSKPHFLDCNESLLEAVEGISPPDRRVHDIVVDVEPVSVYHVERYASTISLYRLLAVPLMYTNNFRSFFMSDKHQNILSQ